MREDWQIITFDEAVTDTQIGLVRNKKQQDGDNEYRYFKMDNIRNTNGIDESSYTKVNADKEEVEKYRLEKGDFLFNTRNSHELVGKSCVYDPTHDETTLFNNNILRARFKETLDSKFIYYSFCSKTVEEQLEIFKSGTTSVVGIYYKALKNLKIPIPPILEQKRIVAILDEAFETIDQAKANVERNIENAEELFQSKLNEIFSQKGQGWEEKKINEIGKTARNIKWEEIDGERKYIDLSSVSRASLSITDTELINRDNAPSRAKKIVKNKDVLFGTTRPTLKRVTIIDEEYSNQICSTGFYVIRPDRNIITSEWVFLFLQTKEFMDRMKKIQSGTSYPAVTYGDMKNSVIRFPSSLKEQQSLSSQLFELRNEKTILIDTYKSKLTALNELKKSILQKAFSGELTANETVAI